MAAPKGHKLLVGKKNARKLKTPELMNEVYQSYCDHLAAGKVKKSWYYDEKGLTLTWETMEKYIANEPSNFDPQKKAVAFSKGYQKWEGVVGNSAEGSNKDANTATLQMLMRNKYGWDKENSGQKETSQPLIQKMAEMWRETH